MPLATRLSSLVEFLLRTSQVGTLSWVKNNNIKFLISAVVRTQLERGEDTCLTLLEFRKKPKARRTEQAHNLVFAVVSSSFVVPITR
jgi:hypothetical protein